MNPISAARRTAAPRPLAAEHPLGAEQQRLGLVEPLGADEQLAQRALGLGDPGWPAGRLA